jgi:hypothetical protein
MNNVSRLNATIKLLFLLGEMLFLVVSLLCFVGAGLVASEQVPLLLFPVAKTTAAIVLAISGAALACSCHGCCAALRQTKRRGCLFARGRIMLCAHQLLLITIMFFGIVNMRYLQNQALRMNAIVADVASFPEYNNFERHVSTYVNQLYFAESFQESAAADWLMNLVEAKCPKILSHCAQSEKEVKDEYCDFSTKLCCPNERLCLDSGLKSACAYDMCRPQLLRQLYSLARPATIFVQVVLMVTLLMLILSCLLICFNKRDEIEVEMLKSGNLAEEDIVAIRERREKMKASTKVRRRTIEFGARKRVAMTKVSPAELA